MDGIKLKRALVTLSFVLGAVAIASYGIRASQAVIYWMVVFFPVAVYFSKDPRSLFVFAVLAKLAWLKTPGFSSHVLAPFNLASGALFVASFALIAMKHLDRPRHTKEAGWLLGFSVVVVFTMVMRGGGFSMLGGTTWGGGRYINLLLVICFFFGMRRFEYNRAHVRWLIWGGIFATGMLAFAQVIFSYTGGKSYGLTNFMQIQAEYAVGSEMSGDARAITRFTHLRWLAYALLPLAFFWPNRKVLSVAIVGASVFMMLMTGFRIEVVSVGMVYIFYGLALSKRKGLFFWTHVVIGVIGYISLLLLSGILPEAAVRSISFLPGISVSAEIATSAAHSTNWRFELWAHCLREAPQYLFIGRGVAFDVLAWAWLNASNYGSTEFYYATHGYHNGPLALLLDFGVFGLLTMTGFFISSTTHLVRSVKEIVSKDSIYYKFAVYLIALYVWMVIKFYLIYGDLNYYLPRMMLIYAMALATLSYLKQSSSSSLTPGDELVPE